MTADLLIRCDCGAFEAVAVSVSPAAGNHTVCYCDDCQAFQHWLGKPERVLDANGGTDVFQMSLGRVRVTAGAEHLACMRLGKRGPLRWYASCCDAAIGNTMTTPSLPFIGLITAGLGRANDPAVVAAALGPRRRGVFGRYAYGDLAHVDAHSKAPISLVVRFVGQVIRWRLRGDHKRTPFFDAVTGNPIADPRLLTPGEREALERCRQAYAAARSI